MHICRHPDEGQDLLRNFGHIRVFVTLLVEKYPPLTASTLGRHH